MSAVDRTFIVLREAKDISVNGVVETHAYAGQGFVRSTSDITKLVPATNLPGFQLRRDVAPAPEITTLVMREKFPTDYHPRLEYIIGDNAECDQVLEAEVEGSKLLVLSGTGSLASATAGQKLEYYEGKLRAVQSGNTSVARILAVLTPDTEGSKRFRIEFTPSL